jgi:hypothetical protein
MGLSGANLRWAVARARPRRPPPGRSRRARRRQPVPDEQRQLAPGEPQAVDGLFGVRHATCPPPWISGSETGGDPQAVGIRVTAPSATTWPMSAPRTSVRKLPGDVEFLSVPRCSLIHKFERVFELLGKAIRGATPESGTRHRSKPVIAGRLHGGPAGRHPRPPGGGWRAGRPGVVWGSATPGRHAAATFLRSGPDNTAHLRET